MGKAVGEAQRQIEIETTKRENLVAFADVGPPRRFGPRDLLAVDQGANRLGAPDAAHPSGQAQAAIPTDLARRQILIFCAKAAGASSGAPTISPLLARRISTRRAVSWPRAGA